MADQVCLSIWLREFSESNMLQLWQRALEAFPASASAPGIQSISVYPFSWAETPVFERSFGAENSAEDTVRLASEFLHEDYAYEAEMIWDLWVQNDSGEIAEDEPGQPGNLEAGWRLAPVSVVLACLGPQFEPDAPEDRADIQIRFGLDSPFLPREPDEVVANDLDYDPQETEARTRENLQQLVTFVHHLDEILPIRKRLLWCESGENLAEKIIKTVTGDK